MKWATIRQLYLSACGQSSAAANEALIHLSEGLRAVTSKMDLQETEETDLELQVLADQDFVEMPDELESIITIFNITTGEKLTAEPTGLRGRASFMEPGEGKPAAGIPQFWVVANNRIYLRPRADDSYLLRLLGRSHSSDPTNETMDNEPNLPPQYHMAVVHAAALSFLALHPDAASQLGDGALSSLRQAFELSLGEKPTPRERESNDRRDRIFLPFRFKS